MNAQNTRLGDNAVPALATAVPALVAGPSPCSVDPAINAGTGVRVAGTGVVCVAGTGVRVNNIVPALVAGPDATTCPICPHACQLSEGQVGRCGARTAQGGAVVSTNYGQATALALDPIEKKPLAQFHPGGQILSYGSFGCNLRCPFCQNSDIAQVRPRKDKLPEAVNITALSPEQLVSRALTLRPRGNIGIAYTYNEPLVGFEFVLDSARLAHKANLKNVIVTNGFVNEQPLQTLLPHLDAANIDLKGFTQDFYDQVGAPKGLDTVKRSIELAAEAIHIEVTTLIVPGLNDNEAEISALASWLASVDPAIPLHLTRFHPAYRMLDTPATPRETVSALAAIARQHLNYVHLGNM